MPPTDTVLRITPIRLGLLLVDDFSLLSYASVIEPFRAANSLSGRELYAWQHVSLRPGTACSSSGAQLLTDTVVGEAIVCDRLFVFAGGDPVAFRDERCFAWLRRMARRGTSIAGVSGGPYLLARAGLLDGHRSTIHWEHAPALREEFPELAVEAGLLVIDGDRMTCAGGTAGLDLALALIADDQDRALADRVGNWFIHPKQRSPEVSQLPSLIERYRTSNGRVLRMLACMEQAIEEPMSHSALAGAVGVSLRQLERLSQRHLAATVRETYLRLRLDRALHLLRTTSLSVTAVGLACGFRSPSHFSRSYRAFHGRAPSRAVTGLAIDSAGAAATIPPPVAGAPSRERAGPARAAARCRSPLRTAR